MGQDETLFSVNAGLGRITLNRPQSLNALSAAQFHDLDERLAAWAGDGQIGAVVIQSLQSGMVLLGFDSAFQQMVVGIVLVGAVGLDTYYRRRTAKG